jgi:predicted ArsR family transcriptional regulator
VLTALQLDGPHDFTALKKRLGAADGSLGLQLQKLEEAEYVRAEKAFVGRRPKTTYSLTRKGQSALAHYLDTLQQLLVAMGRTSGAG